MGEGFVFIEIIFFAMIAAFLVYRLRSVLGRRTGEEEQRPNPFLSPSRSDNAPLTPQVVPMETFSPDEPMSLATALAQIHAADPTFDEKAFIQGARGAFQMIVEAFAKGDAATLRPLLSDDVYDSFVKAIRARESVGETLETSIDRMRETDVTEARLDGGNALLTVTFVSNQINVVRDAKGEIIDGDPKKPVEVVDVWTFSRNTRSQSPNWTLVDTRTH